MKVYFRVAETRELGHFDATGYESQISLALSASAVELQRQGTNITGPVLALIEGGKQP